MKKGRQLLKNYLHNKRYYDELIKMREELEAVELKCRNNKIKNGNVLFKIKKISEEECRIEDELNLIYVVIRDLDQPYRDILFFKYIRQYSIIKIASKLLYSPPRIYQLLDIAEERFYELYIYKLQGEVELLKDA